MWIILGEDISNLDYIECGLYGEFTIFLLSVIITLTRMGPKKDLSKTSDLVSNSDILEWTVRVYTIFNYILINLARSLKL